MGSDVLDFGQTQGEKIRKRAMMFNQEIIRTYKTPTKYYRMGLFFFFKLEKSLLV